MAHVMKAKATDAGRLDTEAFDEKYRAKLDHVEPSRTKHNVWIYADTDGEIHKASPQTGVLANAVKQATKIHRVIAGRKVRSDAVGSVNIIITLPQELRKCNNTQQTYTFFEHTAQFMYDRYGPNFVGGVVHMDESTPHMHAYVIPMIDGKLNAREMFNRAEFKSFYTNLQKYMDARTPGLSILTSTEGECAKRQRAHPGTEGKKTLAELNANLII